jgi:hypothetical protein
MEGTIHISEATFYRRFVEQIYLMLVSYLIRLRAPL